MLTLTDIGSPLSARTGPEKEPAATTAKPSIISSERNVWGMGETPVLKHIGKQFREEW
jgi:hypothetical protein